MPGLAKCSLTLMRLRLGALSGTGALKAAEQGFWYCCKDYSQFQRRTTAGHLHTATDACLEGTSSIQFTYMGPQPWEKPKGL